MLAETDSKPYQYKWLDVPTLFEHFNKTKAIYWILL